MCLGSQSVQAPPPPAAPPAAPVKPVEQIETTNQRRRKARDLDPGFSLRIPRPSPARK